ncbi:serine hydrolase domain-containing protein [Streptomyces sp. NPDC004647]|uniref:serine hydrolase domain-containing protein n=1 Tax=Streptomyces sp. NPDC004647 TaxID=3154671 RepID=UPI0033A03916
MSVRTVRGRVVGVAVAAAVAGTALAGPAAAATTGQGPGQGPGQGGSGGHTATQAAMDADVKAGVPGVLGRAQDPDGVWSGSSGVADLGTQRPRLPQDRFRIGSITKSFVATVLLQLEAEKKLSLDDPVEEWLPGVVHGHGHDGSRITIRGLLNHTSGIYNYTEDPGFTEKVFGKGFLEHRYDTYTPRQLVRIAMRHQPSFEPGTGWSYSNTNYVLAGMIVEKATGRSYAGEIQRRVIRPLGLRSTTLPGTSVTPPGPHGRAYSKLYDESPDATVHDVTDLNPSLAGAAGEMISSAGDLNRFYSSLLRGRLLPDRQLKEMLTTVPTGEPGLDAYGLGISPMKLSCGVKVWGHGGGIHGSGSMAGATRDGRHSAAFNFNADWAGDSVAVLEAEFCGKLPEKGGAKPWPEAPARRAAQLR